MQTFAFVLTCHSSDSLNFILRLLCFLFFYLQNFTEYLTLINQHFYKCWPFFWLIWKICWICLIKSKPGLCFKTVTISYQSVMLLPILWAFCTVQFTIPVFLTCVFHCLTHISRNTNFQFTSRCITIKHPEATTPAQTVMFKWKK